MVAVSRGPAEPAARPAASAGSAPRWARRALWTALAFAAVACVGQASAEVYWGATVPNTGNLPNGLTTVAVTNIDPVATMTVSVSNSAGPLTTFTVAPLETGTYEVPMGLPASNTLTMQGGYKVETDGAAMVAQFTPILSGFSNDATRLLPDRALGRDYWAYAYRTSCTAPPADDNGPSFVTVVGTQSGTTVDITRPSGVTSTVSLTAYQVVQIAQTCSLSGTHVVSNKPVAVFGGNNCTQLGDSACDHIHEQVPPSNMLGRTYVICATPEFRNIGFDLIEVTAANGFTTVDAVDALGGTTTYNLPNAGSMVSFATTRDLVLTATAPVSVGQYYGKNVPGGQNPGDPSLVIPTAVEQMIAPHQIFTSQSWANTVAIVAAPVGATVSVQVPGGASIPIAAWRPIGTTGYQCASQNIPTGTTFFSSTDPVDITALGIGPQGTYWYDTGGNTLNINPPPPPPPPPPVPPPPPPPPRPGPSSSFTVSIGQADCGPVTVFFTDTSTTTGAPITSWYWEFGDGATSTDQNPSHTYEHGGDYTVVHYAQAQDGLHSASTRRIHVPAPRDCQGGIGEPIEPGKGAESPRDSRMDRDSDSDGHLDSVDDCPFVADPGQENIDQDAEGDACDDDMDGDGVRNRPDVCPEVPDPVQSDLDRDLDGDLCDLDRDGDEVANLDDNCPDTANPLQEDRDGDGEGDLCEPDRIGASMAERSRPEKPLGVASPLKSPQSSAASAPIGAAVAGMVVATALLVTFVALRSRWRD